MKVCPVVTCIKNGEGIAVSIGNSIGYFLDMERDKKQDCAHAAGNNHSKLDSQKWSFLATIISALFNMKCSHQIRTIRSSFSDLSWIAIVALLTILLVIYCYLVSIAGNGCFFPQNCRNILQKHATRTNISKTFLLGSWSARVQSYSCCMCEYHDMWIPFLGTVVLVSFL